MRAQKLRRTSRLTRRRREFRMSSPLNTDLWCTTLCTAAARRHRGFVMSCPSQNARVCVSPNPASSAQATRPENIAVDEDCMLALLTQANRLAVRCKPQQQQQQRQQRERRTRALNLILFVSASLAPPRLSVLFGCSSSFVRGRKRNDKTLHHERVADMREARTGPARHVHHIPISSSM